MAASMKKKSLNKEDLRRLMKEHRGSSKNASKKIDHPLAKYNNIGQLLCIACNSQVKSELMWNAHILGRTHKENVEQLKEQQRRANAPKAPSPPCQKRKLPPESHSSSKAAKFSQSNFKKPSSLPTDFFDAGSSSSSSSAGPSTSRGIGLTSYSSESEDEDDDPEKQPAAPPTAPSDVPVTGLPEDFFDSGLAPSATDTQEEAEAAPKTMAEKLPEGFFADPKQDAKARQVEYRDKMEDQWDLFQKVMKEESHVSANIVEEEDEQKIIDRNIDEIDDQLYRWSKIDQLQKKKEEVMSTTRETVIEEKSDSDIDDQEFDEFLNWRSKKAWTQQH